MVDVNADERAARLASGKPGAVDGLADVQNAADALRFASPEPGALGSLGAGERALSYASEDVRSELMNGLAGRLANALGQRIVSGEFAVGDPLPIEPDIQKEYEVSRTVVREAIRLLSAKGLTNTRPKVGTRIRPKTEWNMVDPDVLRWHIGNSPDRQFMTWLFETRELIEPHAAMLASERIDSERAEALKLAFEGLSTLERGSPGQITADVKFHLIIMEATGNPIIRSVGSMICAALFDSFRMTWESEHDDHGIVLHHKVMDAIVNRDPDSAFVAMRRLIRVTRGEALDALLARRSRQSDLADGF